MNSLVGKIDALLPQTQCTRCGFAGCLPYAQALADGTTAINRCPPGGAQTIAELARLLQRPPLPLDADCGVEQPALVAVIDETRCIGCAKCLPPCPVDAIIGASRQMHSVLSAACTGCELCVAPCPVDCIKMLPRASLPGPRHRTAPGPEVNRRRYEARNERIRRSSAERAALLASRKAAAP